MLHLKNYWFGRQKILATVKGYDQDRGGRPGRVMRPIAFAMVLVFGAYGPAVSQVDADEIASCQSNPSADCLADIGIALALASEELPRPTGGVNLLAQMGRIDDAYALEVHRKMLQGASEEGAHGVAEQMVSGFREFEALLASDDLEAARALAGKSKLALFMALSWGTGMAHEGRALGQPPKIAPRESARISEIALQLAGETLDPIAAVSILMHIDQDDAAKSILESPRMALARSSNLLPEMVRLIGTDRALEIYASMEKVRPWYYGALVEAEPDADRAASLLEMMISLAEQAEDPRQRFGHIASVASQADRLGYPGVATRLVEGLQQDFQTDPVAFSGERLRLAQALLVIGAADEDIRPLLEKIESDLPTWEPEIQREAVAKSTARVYVGIHDVEAAVRLLWQTDEEIWDWYTVLNGAAAHDLRGGLLRAAEESLTERDMNMLRARLAQSLSRSDRAPSEIAWASQTAWKLVEDEAEVHQGSLGEFYDNILEVAIHTGDTALEETALAQSVRRALESRQYLPVLTAAHQYHLLRGD